MSMPRVENINMKDWYISRFEAFENHLNGRTALPLHDLRKSAIGKFSELGFPGKRDEEWKYTNVSPILKHKFHIPAAEAESLSANALLPFTFPDLEENLLVFVNGRYSEGLSRVEAVSEGLIIGNLAEGLQENPSFIEAHLSNYANYETEAFTALNTAFANDGAFLYIPENVVLEKPIHLLFLSASGKNGYFLNPRNLILAGKNSRFKMVESHHYLNETVYFNNVVTEIVVQEDARVEHVRIQDEHRRAYHITTLQANQEAGSVYSILNIDMGGAIVRNNINIVLDGENCQARLIGFYMGSDKQHIDNHTLIDHAKPHCQSNELYKGVLGGKARGVFNGKVYVRPDAQKTNAYQNNKALLLTDDAAVNSKPQLEIFADDVKCSHGATVGQLDEEALFYLRTRGIPHDQAYSILQHAFASEVFNYITIDSVREKLGSVIFERFKHL